MSKRIPMVLFWAAILVATLGNVALAQSPTTNDVGYWCSSQEAGVKYVPTEPFVVPTPPDGYVWTLLVIKAGSTGNSVDEENYVVPNPVVGNVYTWEGTWQGQPISKDISHVILCLESSPSTPSTTTSTTSSSTPTTTPTTTTTDPTVTSSSVPSSTTTTSTSSSVTVPNPGTSTSSSTVPQITTTEAPPIGGVPAGGGAMADALDPGTWTWWQIVLVVAGALLLALAGTSAWALSKLAGDIDDELGQR